MIRSAHSARSIIEKKCRERLGQIIRKAADLLTLKGHQGRFFSASKTSWVIVGPKLRSFENVTPNEILAVIFDLLIRKSLYGHSSC
jgi:hypothetical protein